MASRRSFGKTWWGNAWIEAMERIDYNTNRLPRGRRYAGGGMVKEIQVENGEVLARVKGSRPTPYRVKISLRKFDEKQKAKIKAVIAENPVLASQLSLGNLPEEMLAVLEKQKLRLLPASWKDLAASCSCPDWANPCKHLAAVYYLLANEIDKNPFIIFELRGLSAGELMDAAGFS
ncbi:MAG: SWIM zinc finger family protein, partial [Firmicutes bacterium]|nr:SWIM zinc finger family protein [Bacillota bacterium]